jgi:tetratricopeptide (TPR) repeat protein
MKTISTLIMLTIISLLVIPVQAQEDTDINTCLKNYSLYREYYKQKNYKEALPFWRTLYNMNCTSVMKNDPNFAKIPRVIYQNGATIYKHQIASAVKNNQQDLVDAYVDTLMTIYNKRMEDYPGDEGRVLSYKGIDLLTFKKDDPEAVKQAYTCLSKAIDIDKEKVQPATLAAYMDITFSLYRDKIITNEEVVDNYSRTMDIINKKLDEKPDNKEVSDLKDVISANFANSGAANCASLVALFTPTFEANKENPEELKKYILWLKDTNCEDQDLYLNSLIALQKIEPTATAAFTISQLDKKRGQYQQAVDYLKQAVSLEDDNDMKSRYYVELGDITYRIFQDLPAAKNYAEKAIAADPKSGYPNILLGNIYGNVEDYGDDELAHQSVYWAAVDQYEIAKKKDPELATMANEQISSYSKHFPSNETVFFYGYKVGDTYQIGGWINEKTTVRIR